MAEHADLCHYEQYDKVHSQYEDRYITVASYPFDRSIVLVIVWTEGDDNDIAVTRIISARIANPKERKHYEKYLLRKMGS
jgi:uncharacterized DUF497 family protein